MTSRPYIANTDLQLIFLLIGENLYSFTLCNTCLSTIFVCPFSSIQTRWDESDSSRRLSDRIQEINHWKSKLEHCAKDVDKEMDALTQVVYVQSQRMH